MVGLEGGITLGDILISSDDGYESDELEAQIIEGLKDIQAYLNLILPSKI